MNARALWLACLLLAGCNQQLRFQQPEETSEAVSATCEQDADCGAPSLHCDHVAGECVACRNDDDCADPKAPRCDTALHRCVSCGGDLDCASGATCQPKTRTCVMRCAEGVTEADCPDSAPTCDELARICVQCKGDQDCQKVTDDGPYCEKVSGRCVYCTDDRQCPAAAPRCDAVQHRCAECSNARDCPAGGACDPDTLHCI